MTSDGPCAGGDDRPGPYHLHPQWHTATPGCWVQETTLHRGRWCFILCFLIAQSPPPPVTCARVELPGSPASCIPGRKGIPLPQQEAHCLGGLEATRGQFPWGKWGLRSWGDPGKGSELPEEGAWKEPIFLAHLAGIPIPWGAPSSPEGP